MTKATAGEVGRLHRGMGLRSLVLFGVAYLAPIVVFSTFGVLNLKSEGTVAGSYLAATLAVMFTAYSYGRMVSLYPVAGSAYSYVRRAFNGHLGFLVGWAVLLDYFFLPMVVWLIGTAYLSAAVPAVPSWVWVLTFIIVTTGINILGVRIADKVTFALVAFQVLVVLAFAALCLRFVWIASGPGGLLSYQPFFKPEVPFSATLAGGAIAAFAFLGFDAVSTMAEETVEPRKTIPRAIFLVAAVGGVIFILASYLAQLASVGLDFTDVDAAAFTLAHKVGNDVFVAIFLAALVVAQFASGLSCQAATGRLLYAMGRDSVLPRAFFSHINARFHTPQNSLLLTGAVGMLALFLNEESSTSFVNFGAFTAFTFVNLCVIAVFLRGLVKETPGGILLWIVVPAIGAGLNLWLLASLDWQALTAGAVWLTVGIGYLVTLTRGFRLPPPEIHMDEEAV